MAERHRRHRAGPSTAGAGRGRAVHLRADPDRHHQPRRRRLPGAARRRVRRRAARRRPASSPRCWSAPRAVPTWSPGSRAPTRRADALLVHGHLDVVPAEPADWSVHPFSGEIRDGVVWGRGAVDMKNMDAMVLAVVRAWARAGRPAAPRHRARLHRRRGGQRRGRLGLPRRPAPRALRGLHRRHQRVRAPSPSTPAPGCALYPVAAGERGTAWLEAHRPRQGRPRLQGQPGQRREPARRRRRPDRRARVAGAAHPDRAGRADRTRRAARHRRTDLDAPGFDVDELLAKLGPAAALVEPTVRNSANPTMLEAGYKVNVIPGTATAYRRRADAARRRGGVPRRPSTGSPGPTSSGSSTTARSPLQAPVDSPTYARDARGRCRAVRPGRARRAVLHVGRHGRQAVLPARHHRLRLLAAEAAGGLRLPGALPRGGRAGARRGAALRCPRPRPLPARCSEPLDGG